MPGTNLRKKEIDAIRSIADSGNDIARSMGAIADADAERLAFLRSLFGLFSNRRGQGEDSSVHRGGDGGLRAGARNIPPLPPSGPSGVAALPGERPCINVTPAKAPQKKGRLW